MTMIHSWPQAIVHCDADSFYVGCELARRPELKNKPVVVAGKLGSCILSKSYDLKAQGVQTAMPVWEVKKKHPDIIVLEADFAYYNDMSHQMFQILRKWTPEVEVYSVDEAFLDLTGFRRLYKMNYSQIAHAIKEDVKKNLGITVSMGVSVCKTLAKMAAEVNKPDGVTTISFKDIPSWREKFKIGDVPGFGRNTVPLLNKFDVFTCADFVKLPSDTVKKLLHQPGLHLWRELQGEQVFKIETTFRPNKMITRTSSFSPLSSDQHFLWAHTVRHLERALDAMLGEGQMTKEIVLYLRDKEFHRYGWSYRLPTPTASFSVLLEALKNLWKDHFPKGKIFRSTGVTLLQLSHDAGSQFSLFESPELMVRKDRLEQSKQHIKDRYGILAIRAASSLRLKNLGPTKKNPLRAKAFNVEW